MRNRFRRSGNAGVSFFAFQDIITCVTGILVILTVFLSLSIKEGSSVLKPAKPSPTPEMKARLEELRATTARYRETAEADADASTAAPQSLVIEVAMLEQEEKDLREFIEANTKKNKLGSDLEAAIRRNITLAGADARRLTDGILQLKAKLPELSALVDTKRMEVADIQAALDLIMQQNRLTLVRDRKRTDKEPVIAVLDGSGVALHRFDSGAVETLSSPEAFRSRLMDFGPGTHYFVFYNKPSGTAAIESYLQTAREKGFAVGYDAVPEDLIMEVETSRKSAR